MPSNVKFKMQKGTAMSKKECSASYVSEGKKLNNISDSFTRTGGNNSRSKLLLHSCCGPCSTSVIERLAADFDVTVFYFNPCITDEGEYEKRKLNQIKVIEKFNKDNRGALSIDFIEGRYDPGEYLEAVYGLENEPEGGARCDVCFRMRIRETAKKAAGMGYQIFTTTLSVSPHKNYEKILDCGRKAAEEFNVQFLETDFKKKAGFQRSIAISKEMGLYRQDYCGCEFSKREK